jgi:diguanylate cyclase (GGDEF)-like protein
MALHQLRTDDIELCVRAGERDLQQQMAVLQAAVEAGKHSSEHFGGASSKHYAGEAPYRDLFHNSLTPVFRRAPDGHLLLGNPALARMLGFVDLEQLLAARHRPAACPQTFHEHTRAFHREWLRADGTRLNVRETFRAVRGRNGELLYHDGTVEEVAAEPSLPVIEQDFRSLLDSVARNEPLEDILAQLVDLVERQSQGRMACIMLLRAARLYPAAAQNMPDAWFSTASKGIAIGPVAACCGTAVYRMLPVVAENIAESALWQEYQDLALPFGLRSAWSVPIRSGSGDVLGTFDVYGSEHARPSNTEMRLLEMAGKLAAVAIKHHDLHARLEQQARTDRLTGLPNRDIFELCLSAALDANDANGTKSAVLWLDLDRFKEINDTLGHHTGDEVIRQAATRLASCLPAGGMLARTGGDEFAIVLSDVDGMDAVIRIAKKILMALEVPLELAGYELCVSASIGICLYPDHGQTASELQQNSDAAMYAAKQQGKNRYVFYDTTLSTAARERLELETALRRALDRKEFELHYQPQVDLAGNLIGMEALLRWRHPVKGLILPNVFIPIAEENGWIVPIGNWVIQEACRQCAAWQRLGYSPIKVAVNVSAPQLYFSDLVQVVGEALEEQSLDPKWLELELTETLVMRDPEQAARVLTRLRDLGVSVAMDDFGTGYSSLCHLQRLPLDAVKIDRSFLENIESKASAAVIQAITILAHGLGLRVVAEGIENDEQMEALRTVGVDFAQGFLIGRPAPAGIAEAVMSSFIEAA